MSEDQKDAPVTTRMRAGTRSDRRMTAKGATAAGALTSLVVAWSDYFFIQCFDKGYFHFVPLHKTLVEMTAPIVLLPAVIWGLKITGLVGDIITDWLEKRAGHPAE